MELKFWLWCGAVTLTQNHTYANRLLILRNRVVSVERVGCCVVGGCVGRVGVRVVVRASIERVIGAVICGVSSGGCVCSGGVGCIGCGFVLSSVERVVRGVV